MVISLAAAPAGTFDERGGTEMSRRLEQAAAAALLLAAGCHFAADYDGTHFKCGDVEPRCPPYQACVDGLCVGPDMSIADARDDDPEHDGGGKTIDAAVIDGKPGHADARPDARPDAHVDAYVPPPPDATPVTPPGLEAVADATLDSQFTTRNYGASTTLEMRNGAPRATAVLRFDLSSITPGTQILHATLHVRVPPGGADAATVELHRLLEPFQEGNQNGGTGACSWRDRSNGSAWTGAGAQGGSRAFEAMGTIDAAGDGVYDVSLDVPTVQSWVTSPSNNNGMVLIPVAGTSLDLSSRESAAFARPHLELAFAFAPP